MITVFGNPYDITGQSCDHMPAFVHFFFQSAENIII